MDKNKIGLKNPRTELNKYYIQWTSGPKQPGFTEEQWRMHNIRMDYMFNAIADVIERNNAQLLKDINELLAEKHNS
jgi:hypothetical protein